MAAKYAVEITATRKGQHVVFTYSFIKKILQQGPRLEVWQGCSLLSANYNIDQAAGNCHYFKNIFVGQ